MTNECNVICFPDLFTWHFLQPICMYFSIETELSVQHKGRGGPSQNTKTHNKRYAVHYVLCANSKSHPMCCSILLPLSHTFRPPDCMTDLNWIKMVSYSMLRNSLIRTSGLCSVRIFCHWATSAGITFYVSIYTFYTDKLYNILLFLLPFYSLIQGQSRTR